MDAEGKGGESVEKTAVLSETGRRYSYLDAMRILAILLVLFIHTGTRGSYLFQKLTGSWTYWPALANGILCWTAVPLFFMTSGALLLGREESCGAVLRRFFRFFLVLLLCSALQYYYLSGGKLEQMHLWYYIQVTYYYYILDTYWFLYTYLGFLLTLPLLRRMASAMENRDFWYLLALYALLKLMHVGELLYWQGEYTLNRSVVIFTAADCVFYPLLGYWLHSRVEEEAFTGRRLLLLTAGSLAALGLCSVLFHHASAIGAPEPGDYYTSFLYLPVLTLFYAMRLLFLRHPPGERIAAVLRTLGACSFGVYLFENVFKRLTEPVYKTLAPHLGRLPACWLWIAASYLVGCAAVWLLKKIPGLRRLL